MILSAKQARGQSTRGRPAQTLYRRGRQRQKADEIAQQAEAAERALGIHGISVTVRRPDSQFREALREAVEKAGFRVHKTGRDPDHYTVEFPKPVTPEWVDRFYALFRPGG